MIVSRDQAEIIGVNALGWLVGNEELLPVFMGATGASAQDLRDGAQDPVFLGAVLDFILMDDNHIMELAEAINIKPELPYAARAALPGGAQETWP